MLRLLFCLLLSLALAAAASQSHTPYGQSQPSTDPDPDPAAHPHNKTGPPFMYFKRPVASPQDTLRLTAGLYLLDVDVDESHQTATVGGWLDLRWQTQASWAEGELDKVSTSPGAIWTPDLWPYHQVPMAAHDWVHTVPVVVRRSGEVHWVPPVTITVRCHHTLSASKERLICPITLGSWTYDTDQLDLEPLADTLNVDYFIENGHWAVETTSLTREVNTYACCSNSYATLKFELVLKPQHC